MAFQYYAPGVVVNPVKYIRAVHVLYDGGAEGFSLARVDWEGLDHMAMRWNIAFSEQSDAGKQAGLVVCSGSPSLKGVPSWFILPRELFHPAFFDRDSEVFLKLAGTWTMSGKEVKE